MGSVMSPRLVVINKDGDGFPSFPGSVDDGGTPYALFRGAARPLDMGGFPAREYRDGDGDVCFVVQKLAASGARVLALIWVPSDARDDHPALYKRLGQDLMTAGVILKSWACVLMPDGTFELPALEADGTAAGTAAKAAWPASWRRYQGAEHSAVRDPVTGVITSPQVGPTGVMVIGGVLA